MIPIAIAFGQGFAEGLGLCAAVALVAFLYLQIAKTITKGTRR
ncbi:hypothetical protein [Phenylobacterium sp.]